MRSMRFTTVQINGLVAISILGLLALVQCGFFYVHLLNPQPSALDNTFLYLCGIHATTVGGIVWVAKSWGGYAANGQSEKSIVKDWEE